MAKRRYLLCIVALALLQKYSATQPYTNQGHTTNSMIEHGQYGGSPKPMITGEENLQDEAMGEQSQESLHPEVSQEGDEDSSDQKLYIADSSDKSENSDASDMETSNTELVEGEAQGPKEQFTIKKEMFANGDIKCPMCARKLKSPYAMVRHFRQQHKNIELIPEDTTTYKCKHPSCGKFFARLYTLKSHMRVVHDEKVPEGYECRFCKAFFPTKTQQSVHRKANHPNVPVGAVSNPTGNGYKCPEVGCDKVYQSSSALRKHKKQHRMTAQVAGQVPAGEQNAAQQMPGNSATEPRPTMPQAPEQGQARPAVPQAPQQTQFTGAQPPAEKSYNKRKTTKPVRRQPVSSDDQPLDLSRHMPQEQQPDNDQPLDLNRSASQAPQQSQPRPAMPAKVYRCVEPGCGKIYNTSDSLSGHRRRHAINAERDRNAAEMQREQNALQVIRDARGIRFDRVHSPLRGPTGAVLTTMVVGTNVDSHRNGYKCRLCGVTRPNAETMTIHMNVTH